MTCSKDSKVQKDDNLWSWSEIVHRHSDKAIKACVFVLAILSICLIAVAITIATRPAKVSTDETNLELKERRLPTYVRETTAGGCELIEMTINCQNTSRIYHDVYNAILAAPFKEKLVLNIESQHFPNYVLTNNWISADSDIQKITISNSYFSNIRNEAFNCVDFTNTYALNLVGVKLSLLTNGVLLGLSKLLYLRMTGSIGRIHRCFFQPVQSSLVRLKLSADLVISGNENVFGVSVLPRLTVLDLSDNTITGTINRNFFFAVPNVKCVTISNSKIKAISGDAFDDIAENLEILDLSNNLLTSIDVASFEGIFKYGKVNTYLLGNAWLCKCQLLSVIKLYEKYESRFGDIPYCIGPPSLYGVLFSNVSFDTDCVSTINDDDLSTGTSGTLSTNETKLDDTKTTSITPFKTTTAPPTTNEIKEIMFQMRCLSLVNLSDDDAESSDERDYFSFDPPCHDFSVLLLTNNSVKIFVQSAEEPLNIVWFSDAIEHFVYTTEDVTFDYNCEGYNNPYLIIDNLSENNTYTFCLLPVGFQSITPFNCLPLHIPMTLRDDDMVWISTEDEQLTVAIVCVIFSCSALLGGAIAYFGIKSYPDLLEGSRHVLVVKRSDQTCYVSTITEGEYIINRNSKKSLKKTDSIKKLSLSQLSHNNTPELSPFSKLPAYESPISTTIESTDESEDHYELPAVYNKIHQCNLTCIPNKYEPAMSSMSPPPLPKRNSTSTIQNLNSEFSHPKTYPKMSI